MQKLCCEGEREEEGELVAVGAVAEGGAGPWYVIESLPRHRGGHQAVAPPGVLSPPVDSDEARTPRSPLMTGSSRHALCSGSRADGDSARPVALAHSLLYLLFDSFLLCACEQSERGQRHTGTPEILQTLTDSLWGRCFLIA